jgi:UDP-N-acetyl-D-mannosaminuronic acid dehydrogenase
MTICVHGLGYVGISTAALFANHGHDVTGFDVDADIVSRLQRGDSHVGEPELDAFVERALSAGLSASDHAVPADHHVVCVPTPFDEDADEADLEYVEAAGRNVAAELRPGDAVVLESTVPPGTTTGRFRRTLEDSALTAGEDFHLAYSPETVMPGNTVPELRTNDRIVGGVDDESTRVVAALYADATEGDVHEAPSATTAEFVKVAQNAARDAEIAFANTLALVADDYGIDVRTAIGLANEHPRVDVLDPGPGVGGHCLPFDPLFLEQGSDQTELIDAARTVNDRMPGYVVDKLLRAIEGTRNPTVAVLGVAYKGNTADVRNSPGLEIARQLDGATTPPLSIADGGFPDVSVRIHDPHVSDATLALEPLDDAVDGADGIVVGAGHDEFTTLDPERVGDAVERRLVVDPVAVLDHERWRRHGFEVIGL